MYASLLIWERHIPRARLDPAHLPEAAFTHIFGEEIIFIL